MKYEIGTIVILVDGKNIYITGYDKTSQKYKGFDVKDNGSQKEIVFSAADVIMKV